MDTSEIARKHQHYRLKVKLWEKEFKDKNGRVPSKHDIKEAGKTIQDAYKMYCKLKTTLLEATVGKTLVEEDENSSASFNLNMDDSQDSFILPSFLEAFDAALAAPDTKIWGQHLNHKLQKSSSEMSTDVSKKGLKLSSSKSFTIRNPRRSLTFSQSFSQDVLDDVTGAANERDMQASLPDLETILIEKAKKVEVVDGEETDEKPSSSVEPPPPTTEKKIINLVDSEWLKRRETSIGEQSNESSSITFPVQDTSSLITFPVQDTSSLGLSALSLTFTDSSQQTSKCDSSHLSGDLLAVSNSDIEELANNPVVKKRKMSDKQIEVTIEGAKVEREPRRKSLRAKIPAKTCNDLSSEDEDPFAGDDDDSDHDPNFKVEEERKKVEKKPSRIQKIKKIATKLLRTKCKKDIKEPLREEPEETEFSTYMVEFGVENFETVPRLQEAQLEDSTKLIDRFISQQPLSDSEKPSVVLETFSNEASAKAKKRLEKKVAGNTVNENFVRLNLRKKVFVRGKKTFNFSKHKKSLWRKKKAAALAGPDMDMGGCDGGELSCFQCGGIGHFARQCKQKGDDLLPLDADVEESPFPTLNEAAVMANKERPCTSEAISAPVKLPLEILKALSLPESKRKFVDPMYELQADGLLRATPEEVFSTLSLFGHSKFRAGQEKAIMRILSGLSTLVTLSTGSGKSLCYQLPAYLYRQKQNCVSLVISPLVSLMEDQVHGVPKCLNVQCLHTNQTEKQRAKIMEMIDKSKLDILLVSPEAIVAGEKSTGFGALLRRLPPIAFACIDEAHCVSQWSHNFRPSYLMICRVLREKLGVKTILGLTATATASTRRSIIEHIGISDGMRGVISDIPLPDNLFLSISKDKDRDNALIDLLRSERFESCESIIVYCTRREECERLAGFIRTCLQESVRKPDAGKRKRLNWIAEPYHAGMVASRRRAVQNAFMSGDLRIVVATVAFGMGINKANIRAVIHYNMPKSFESYVQEVGRAGRDGQLAHCHLFLDSRGGDRNELRRHIYANSIDRYVIRKLLQKIFVPCACEKMKSCPGHEVCFSVEQTVQMLDVPEENIMTLLCYLELHEKRLIQVLSRAFIMCKVISYGGTKKLREAAKNCPPLAMAIALDLKNGISHDNSTVIEFPVVQVASLIGWDSGVVKYRLKDLEWISVNGHRRRSTISVQFHDLGFRVRAPGNLTDYELDSTLDLLHERVVLQEKTEIYQLDTVFEALQSVAFNSYHPIALKDCSIESSNKLKMMIRSYFQKEDIEKAEPSVMLDEINVPDEQIILDIHTMIQRYPENTFTGRALARIFHGVPSPNYPAQIWGRCKYWRAYMNVDFNKIVNLANVEILKMRT